VTRGKLKDLLWQDIDFSYQGKEGSFCPIEVYAVTYGGDSREFDDFDAAIDEPMFNGKSLLEIADEIEY